MAGIRPCRSTLGTAGLGSGASRRPGSLGTGGGQAGTDRIETGGTSGGGTNPDLGRQYDVSRDGRFLVNVALDAAPIAILQNWKPPSN